MKENNITNENIQLLMDIFYDKIRVHKNLGPIFNSVIKGEQKWQEHKIHIGNFWRHMLLGQDTFSGQPLKKHLELPSFPKEFFDDWLNLFSDSLNQIYEPQLADFILQRAQMIAFNFKKAIYEFHS